MDRWSALVLPPLPWPSLTRKRERENKKEREKMKRRRVKRVVGKSEGC